LQLALNGSRCATTKVLFLGPGEAGTGIADLFVAAAKLEGLSEAEAHTRCWFVDRRASSCATG